MNVSFLAVLLVVMIVAVVMSADRQGEEITFFEEELRETLDNMSLAMLVNMLEEQGVHLGDNYYSNEELIEHIVQLTKPRREPKGTSTTAKNEQALPTAAKIEATAEQSSTVARQRSPSTWEMFKEQILSDFAPVILLIPSPVKSYLAHMLPKLHTSAGLLLRGAMVPMLRVVVHALKQAGNLFVAASSRLDEFIQGYKESPTKRAGAC